ncbi:tetratricopeptide repeat protein [Candidatus Desulfofervidus auxilii]|nr:tetratricopeptide repeat protein [Candidatus Desulfofervidus auxilii]
MPKNIYRIVKIEDVDTDLVKQLCNFLELFDVKEEEIQKVLAQRINASPGLGDESDVNPYSLPISLEPIERWNNFQLGLLEQYTGQLRSKLYGSETISQKPEIEQRSEKTRLEIYSLTPIEKSQSNPEPQTQTLPIAIFDVHGVCNQTCPYCVAKRSKDFGPIVKPEPMKKIRSFFKEHGPFNIVFTGGEPLITPGIWDFFKFLVNEGHLISLQTNLKVGADLFSQAVSPEQTGWILTTFHSVELKRFECYLRNIRMLKKKGYPLVVKLILDDSMLKEFVSIYDTLKKNGIGVILSPLINFPPNSEPFPKQYTPEQWSLIAPRITLRSSWLYFAGGWRSRGALCYAGSKVFYFRPWAPRGRIDGCAHSFPRNIGSLYTNKFSPLKEPVRCGLDLCICDFNYYTGIIPKLDDSKHFKTLLSGKVQPVPFSAYFEYIKQADIYPLIDLQPIISKINLVKDIRNWAGSVKSVVAKRGSNQFVHSSTMSESFGEGRSRLLGNSQTPSYISIEKPSTEWKMDIAKTLNQQGEELFIKGDTKGALNAFLKAIEIDPNLAVAYNNLGVLYWQAREVKNALGHFKKALKLDPYDRNIILNCGKVLTDLGKIEDAKEVYSYYLKKNPNDEEISRLLADIEVHHSTSEATLIKPEQIGPINIPIVSVQDLHKKLGFETPINYPKTSLEKPLNQWKMEIDDAPIFRYIYRNFRPRRHLEFGTWQGTGVVYCLEECDATVWTINLPFGENKKNGYPAYAHYPEELPSVREWAKKIGLPEKATYRTDSIGFIGRRYLEKELGHRVCQIYCDSRKWDISNYPPGFFDTILIDGGHTKDIVINDTRKAFRLLRQGGIVMWHDFCPPVFKQFECTHGVMEAISQDWDWVNSRTNQLFWIYPSWILLGVKK